MNVPIFAVVSALVLALSGCTTTVDKKEPAVDLTAKPILPFPEPQPVRQELDEELVYSYLLGEIAAHRGELQVAQQAYFEAATMSGDAYAAERATRIALHQRDYAGGLEAVEQWVERAPNDATARQLAAVLLLREGRYDDALMALDALVRIADAKGQDGFLQAAGALSAEKDADAALRLMEDLHRRYPEDVRSLYGLAVLETAQQRLTAAEQRLLEVIDREPGLERARVLLVRVLVAQERRDDALALLKDSVRRFPGSVLLRTTYSRVLVDAGDYAEALKQFRKLHELAPDDEEITFGYAMLATQQEDWAEARPLWQELRGSQERQDEASYYLAQIEEELGNDDTAVGLYGTVGGDELKVDAAMRKAQVLGRTERVPQAREVLQQARIANPGRAADLYIVETQIVQKHGSPDVAVALYDSALAAFPDNHDLRYNRALFVLERGDFDAMELDLRRILKVDPEHADSLNALGYTLAERNERLDEARVLIEEALRLRPESAAVLDSMGWVLYRLGELEQAIGYLQRAYETGPDDEIAAHLGEVYWVSGRRDDAKRIWREGLVETPESEKIRQTRERLQDGAP